MDKMYIIAGNHREYINFCKEKKINARENIYIGRADQLRGLATTNIHFYGTYRDRPDAYHLHYLAQNCIDRAKRSKQDG